MGGDRKWLKLNASDKNTYLAISRSIDQSLANFDSNVKRNAGGPVGSSLGFHQRQALSRIATEGNSEKHAACRVK